MKCAQRTLTVAEETVLHKLYTAKELHLQANAYVTTTQELPMTEWNGRHPVEKNQTTRTIPAGTTLKIVMVSRFGDCGLTDDLEAEYGYGLRLDLVDPAITDIRTSRASSLAND